MSFLNELKRRNVFRVAAAYLVSSWLLIQVAETIFPLFGFDDTPARMVVIVLAVAFIPSLVFSWVFEITPEGLKRDADIDHDQSKAQAADKKFDRIILAVLALALGYFAFDKFVLDPARDQSKVEIARQEGRTEAMVESYGDKSIAVLPFVNMSSDPEQEYFSDGISEELLNLLTKIPELRVISRSSAFSFKGKEIEIPEVARQLSVSHILEGSVRKAGSQLRVTVQLIEARSDSHLWSETYDRKLDNVFQIQDEIARSVVEALKIELLDEVPQTRRTDQEAFRLVLLAKYFWNRRSPGDVEKTMDYYQQAVEIDPSYAAAWTGLSVAYAAQAANGGIPREIGLTKAREAVETALLIDPDYSDAHVRMGQVFARNFDHEAALEEYQKAIALDPNNPLALGAMAAYIWSDGYLDEAIDLYKKASVIDPLAPIWPGNMSDLLIKAGRLDEAEDAVNKVFELSPNSLISRVNRVQILFWRGQLSEALELTLAFPESANRTFGLTMTYHAMGRHDESDAAMQRLINDPVQNPVLIALAYAFRGDPDKAFEWLEEAVKDQKFKFGVFKFEPFLKNLHTDPRWEPFLYELGMPR